MVEEIKAKYADAKIELIEGGGGIFDVKVSGKMIYSKSETGRFPESGEVLKTLESL